MLTTEDLKQINEHGLSSTIIDEQISRFIEGFPPADLVDVATVNNGIKQLEDSPGSTLILKQVRLEPDPAGDLNVPALARRAPRIPAS